MQTLSTPSSSSLNPNRLGAPVLGPVMRARLGIHIRGRANANAELDVGLSRLPRNIVLVVDGPAGRAGGRGNGKLDHVAALGVVGEALAAALEHVDDELADEGLGLVERGGGRGTEKVLALDGVDDLESKRLAGCTLARDSGGGDAVGGQRLRWRFGGGGREGGVLPRRQEGCGKEGLQEHFELFRAESGAVWKGEVAGKMDDGRLSVRLASHSVKYNSRLDRGRYTESDMVVISEPYFCFLRVPATKYPAVAVVSRSAVSVLNVWCRLRRQNHLLMQLGGTRIRMLDRKLNFLAAAPT